MPFAAPIVNAVDAVPRSATQCVHASAVDVPSPLPNGFREGDVVYWTAQSRLLNLSNSSGYTLVYGGRGIVKGPAREKLWPARLFASAAI